MKPFFKPEDFYTPGELDTRRTPQQCSDIANAKLEREGKAVYGLAHSPHGAWTFERNNDIETEIDASSYKCQCGARVTPTKFVAEGDES